MACRVAASRRSWSGALAKRSVGGGGGADGYGPPSVCGLLAHRAARRVKQSLGDDGLNRYALPFGFRPPLLRRAATMPRTSGADCLGLDAFRPVVLPCPEVSLVLLVLSFLTGSPWPKTIGCVQCVRVRQEGLWMPTPAPPVGGSHPFYLRSNQIPKDKQFDKYVEAICERFYAGDVGRRMYALAI